MNARTIVIFVILLCGTFVVGFVASYLSPYLGLGSLWVTSTSLEEESIDGIRLGDSFHENKWKMKYGEYEELDIDLYKRSLDFEPISVSTDQNDQIVYLSASSPEITTSRRVHVGNTMDDVIRAYGKDYFKEMEQGNNKVVYLDRDKGMRLKFWEYQGEVLEIRMMMD
ncbi:hypothetical protein [Desmospora profundinema]|uniref:Uncharacterized protein n=1 Tax=Desmospora profundinema TaxID=1571184 RepID=A0ABU1IU86_9BACL|nr:hypothetical protein [Desmospora profundinema]MDR6227320.1 hypothetical protein [Desmospora profundinema]